MTSQRLRFIEGLQFGHGLNEKWALMDRSRSRLFENGGKKPDRTGPEGTNPGGHIRKRLAHS